MQIKLSPKLFGFRLKAYNDHDLTILIFSYVFFGILLTHIRTNLLLTINLSTCEWMSHQKNIILFEKYAYKYIPMSLCLELPSFALFA